MSTAPPEPPAEEIRAGLRMRAPLDPAAVAREARELEAIEALPPVRRTWALLRRGGPGYLQSALTLGGGTAASAIFAGQLFGYRLLWVAPFGMLLGVVMLGALAHQTLSTGMRPFEAMRRFAGAPFAWAWALGALVASVIWHFPQYSLAGAALSDLADVAGARLSPALAAWLVLLVAVPMSLLYGTSARAVRWYENGVKLLVFGVVASFGAVVLATAGSTDWGLVLRGFVPSIPSDRGGVAGLTLVASGVASAVGINMVFLYPYSMLARGWGRSHRRLARTDLVAGMLVPYTIATSLVIIATANAIPFEDGLGSATRLKPVEAARALGDVIGETRGRLVFDLGLLGMALSTITLHMVVTGFVVIELTGAAFGSAAWRAGTLLPAVGVLGPVLWNDPLWLAIPTSVVCMLFLPLAYVGLIRLQASRAYLGADRPSGAKGALWIALMVATTAFLVWVLAGYLREKVL